ncbi:Zona pellucida-like domain [Mactra antiquata]
MMECSRHFLWILFCIVYCGIDHVFSQSNGDLRLRGTNSTATQGRLEVYYENAWGLICDDAFGREEAIVACRQLGSPTPASAEFVIDGRFGHGTGNILMDNINCIATETRLDRCQFNGWGIHNCGPDETVGVICHDTSENPITTLIPPTTKPPIRPDEGICSTPDPNIRLVGPADRPGVGVVQVRRNGVWGIICDDGWDIQDAKVVCRMLCFDASRSLAGSVPFDTSNISEPMTINNVGCRGNEANITACDQSPWAENSCGRTEMARVTCTEMNNEAPMKPRPVLECTDGYLSAGFSRTRDPYLEEKHLSVATLTSGACNVVKETDDNFVTIRIPFDECGTERTSNSTHMIYRNIIKYMPTYSVGDVSFANTYMVEVQCELPRNVLADKPIEPLTETVTQSAPGEFIVNMLFYTNGLQSPGGNGSFSVPVSVFPLQIPLGEWLTSALALTDVDENLRLVVPNCYATPTADRNSTISYPLFTDKCIDDQTVGFFPINESWWGYRYQTFKFVAFSEVYIHCDAYICDQADESPECDRSCFPSSTTSTTTTANNGVLKRRKRSLARRYTHVSSPTIIVMDMNAPNEIVRPEHTTRAPNIPTNPSSKDISDTSHLTASVVTIGHSTKQTEEPKVVASVESSTSKESVTPKSTTLKTSIDTVTRQPTSDKSHSSVTEQPEFSKTEASFIEAIYVSGNHAEKLYNLSNILILFLLSLYLLA